jgi:peptide/nickel transport system substrate-binding protein
VGLRARPLIALAVCAVVGATLAATVAGPSAGRQAAGASQPPTTTTTTLPGQGRIVLKNGGSVTVAVPSLPTNFNPSVPAGANRVTQMITEQVWPRAFTVTSELSPQLDSDFVTSAYLTAVNPQRIVYTIASGARWSDGTPITAADFVYFWHQQLAYGPQLPANDPISGYQDIKSVAGSNGGRTVTVVFVRPYSDWEALFANLVPAHIAEQSSFATAFAAGNTANLVSGGPFEITKVVPGVEVDLSRNPHYWGTPARLDHIIFKVVPGDRAVLSQLRSGGVQIGEVSPGTAADSVVAASPGVLTEGTKLSPVEWQLVFNLARPTLAQPVVREALSKAIDRHEILADTAGLAAPSTPTDANRLYAAGAPGSQGNDGGYAHADDAEADNLLTQLGYSVSPTTGMVQTPTGAPLVLTVIGPSGNPMIAKVEALLQAQLLQAGIALEVKNVPESQLLANVLPTGAYEMALAPYPVMSFASETQALYTDPVGPTPINVAASSAASPSTTIPGALPGHPQATNIEPGAIASGAVSRDVLGFSDPGVTALYAQASAELAPPAAADLYNQIDQTLWRDLPTLPLFQAPVTLVNRANILNVINSETWAGPLWNAEDWVIELSPVPTTTTTTPVG